MRSLNSKALSTAVRYALLTSAVAASGYAAGALAQDTANELEEVIVTGSLIPQDLNAPGVPVSMMSAADIDASGVSGDLLDVLNKTQPFFYGGLNIGSENGNISSNSTNGGSQLALRNRSTLVLINGRRAAVSPVAASGGFNFVDVSMIPVSAVERMEILADGASATYGADAVGGVVNVIMKSNYEGIEAGGRYGTDQWGKYTEKSAYVTMGAGNETTNITVSGEWKKSDPLLQADRSWGRNIYRTQSFAGVVNAGTHFYYLNPSLNAPDGSLNLTPAELVAAGVYSDEGDGAKVPTYFDLSKKPTMLIGTERKSAVLAWNHDVNDYASLFGDFLVSNTQTVSQLNAQPVSGTVAATNPNNPFNQSLTVRNRFAEYPRIYANDTTGWRGVFGVRGDIVGSWKYELAGDWNYATSAFRNKGLIDAAAYNAAIANGTYNPFARVQAPGVVEAMSGTAIRDYVSTLNSYDFKVYGDLFELPGGNVQLAVGADTREERLTYNNDRNDQTGGWLQATPTKPFKAKMQSQGYFAEVRVPVFSDLNAITGFQALDISIAGRQEVYTTTDDPFVPKYSFRWQPFGEAFAVRGSYSESFTSPSLYELFGPIGQGFTSNLQLDRYDASGNSLGVKDISAQYRSQSGSNTELDPSTAKNWSVGVEWAPVDGKLAGLKVGADYWTVKEKDIVGTLPSSIVLQSVEALGPNSPYASYVRRGTSAGGEVYFGTGTPIAAPGEITSAVPDTVWLSVSNINLASVEQDGLDLRASYAYETDALGTFSVQLNSTFLFNYETQPIPTEPVIPLAGTYHDDYGLFPDFRLFSQFGWAWRGFTAGLNGQYLPSMDDATNGKPYGKIEDYMSWDIRVGYDFTEMGVNGLSLTAGMNNMFDEEPVYIESEGNQSRDISNYDPVGRYWYMQLGYKF